MVYNMKKTYKIKYEVIQKQEQYLKELQRHIKFEYPDIISKLISNEIKRVSRWLCSVVCIKR